MHFALKIFDKAKKMAATSKIRRKKEEQPRKQKKINVSNGGQTDSDAGHATVTVTDKELQPKIL